jgi:hypothetical protein
MSSQGARVIRLWVFADARYAPDFNSDGTVSGLDASVLADVNKALEAAARNNTYLLLTVLDSSAWSNATYSGAVQMGGRASMITNATVQQTFLDRALKPLLQHVAASPYKSRVLGWDIINEPEAQMSAFWGGVNLPTASVQTFVKRCTEYIHSYGGGAYATVGSAAPQYVGTWKNLGLDFYQVHFYPWMDDLAWGQPAGSGLLSYASLGLDRPCIVGEYPSNGASYNWGDTNVFSGKWYLDQIKARGYAGGLAWSTNVADSATNWGAFQPLFTRWGQENATIVGPR